jgi:organic radical activating enzyme
MSVILNEYFIGIEGEGVRQGFPTFFIRFQGCTIHCNFCDTKDSWNSKEGTVVKVDLLIKTIIAAKEDYKFEYVSLTGGNPVEQPLFKLIGEIKNKTKLKIHMEHPGIWLNEEKEDIVLSLVDSICFDIKPLSSGLGEETLRAGAMKTFSSSFRNTQLKLLFENKEDIDYYVDLFYGIERRFIVTLSPIFSGNKIKCSREVLDYAMLKLLEGRLGSKVSLRIQQHKILGELTGRSQLE